jgi:hypothetical protein
MLDHPSKSLRSRFGLQASALLASMVRRIPNGNPLIRQRGYGTPVQLEILVMEQDAGCNRELDT